MIKVANPIPVCLALVVAVVAVLLAVLFGRPSLEEPPSAMEPAAPAHDVRALPGGGRMPMAGMQFSGSGRSIGTAVLWYLLLGGRLVFDAGSSNHREIGTGIRAALARGVQREDVFVASRVTRPVVQSGEVHAHVRQVLQDLALDHLDLVVLDSPTPYSKVDPAMEDAWEALELLQERQQVRDIGVSWFGPKKLQELLARNFTPAVNVLEYHPAIPDRHREAVELGNRHNVVTLGFKAMAWDGALSKHPVLRRVGEPLGKTPNQVIQRWALQKGIAYLSTSTGAVSSRQIRESVDTHSFQLSERDIGEIDAIGDGLRAAEFRAPMSP